MMNLSLKFLVFAAVLVALFGCREDEESPLLNKLVGSYEGVVHYHDNPIPGDDKIEILNFAITKEGNDKIKITTTFDLVLPVTGTFTDDGDVYKHEIISLGTGKDITYNSNGIEITSGITNFNNWGKMCGYYDVTGNELIITFGWTNGSEGGGGFIAGTRKE